MNATWTDPKVIKQYFAWDSCSFIALVFRGQNPNSPYDFYKFVGVTLGEIVLQSNVSYLVGPSFTYPTKLQGWVCCKKGKKETTCILHV